MNQRQLQFLCKRKILKVIPLCVVIVIMILLLCCEGWLSWFERCQKKEDVQQSTNSDFIKTKEKIHILTSLLKRFKVPEELYKDTNLPVIYVITPTFARPVQKAELTRLKNTFLHIPALHWIVVEDADEKSQLLSKFLASSNLRFTHLHVGTPPQWKLKFDDPRWYKPRGVFQRNEGIKWLRSNVKPSQKGVVYFADDDNTYSIELFEEMRFTNKVSVWPVGLVGGVMVERPSVNSQGVVDGWLVGWRPYRQFAIDMAGFAVNLSLLLQNSEAYFRVTSQRGLLESDFLELLIKQNLEELEPKANGCTQVLVWHTQTKNPTLNIQSKMKGNAMKLEI